MTDHSIDLSLFNETKKKSAKNFELRWFDGHLRSRSASRRFFVHEAMDLNEFLLDLAVFIEVILFVMSVAGNMLVLIVMVREKNLRETPANYYIIAIAVADLVTGAFAIPFFLNGVRSS